MFKNVTTRNWRDSTESKVLALQVAAASRTWLRSWHYLKSFLSTAVYSPKQKIKLKILIGEIQGKIQIFYIPSISFFSDLHIVHNIQHTDYILMKLVSNISYYFHFFLLLISFSGRQGLLSPVQEPLLVILCLAVWY